MNMPSDVAVLALCLTALVPVQSLARDDGRFANSPLKPWFDLSRAERACAAPLPTASACKMSTGIP